MPDSFIEELALGRIGRTLSDKWTLESLLGVGGTAAVYAATHRNGARVAIKILHPTISASDEARIRFKREGYIVNRIEHPGVVPVLDDDVDETDGSAFIVMERAEGVSLCDRVQRRLLDENEVLEVAEQVLEILAAAHEKGVVHRDLKPDNLLVDERGRVRLLDFGIARLLDDDANLTRTGFTFGTPAYMAPEQAYGKKHLIGPQTDVYAMGATIFTLLSGEYVQEAETSQEQLIKIATQPARSLADVLPDASPEVITLVDRATMMHLEDRWPSAAAMLERVRMLMRARGLDGSRRHISSRISAMILPLAGEVDSCETAAAIDHAAGTADTPALLDATPRASLVRAKRARTRKTWAVASAAAMMLVGTAVGWPRAPHTTPHQAAASTIDEATARAEVVAPAPSASADKEARLDHPTAVAPEIAPDTHTPGSATAPVVTAPPAKAIAKKPRRKIDVGY